MQVGRLKYEKPSRYNKGVLLGNWFEERNAYTKNKLPHALSTCQRHFIPKPYSANNPEHMWDMKFQAEGMGARTLTDHGRIFEYLDNMSTVYDLAYNHFPKQCPGSIYRHLRSRLERFEPEDEYLRNYGNITEYGLLKLKQEQWRCERGDPRITYTTSYQDAYTCPKKEDYPTNRRGVPLPNSSKMDTSFDQFVTLNLRNNRTRTMRGNEGLVPVCQEPKCNPITWECPTALEQTPARCVPTPD